MAATFINIPLPVDLYSQLESMAQRLEKSAETFLTETLQIILSTNNQALSKPKSEDEIPQKIRDDIASLEMLDIADLQKISASEMPLNRQEDMDTLLYLQRVRPLTNIEEVELEELRMEYGHVMLRKARSFALLAQRGYPLPTF